jgi:hypothetical protein
MAVTAFKQEGWKYQDARCNESETRRMLGNFTITGGAGAIASQRSKNLTWVRTSAGLYTGTPDKTYRRLIGADTMMGGVLPVPTTTGINPFIFQAGSNGGQVQVQFFRTDTGAAADPAAGTVCYVEAVFSDDPQ